MTDNEIIKALECCANAFDCPDCPFEDDCGSMQKLSTLTVDLINRLKANEEKNANIIRLADKTIEKQQAEIERLQCEVENYCYTLKDMMERESKHYNESKMYKTSLGSVCKELETAKFEARKEFAERLKKVMVTTRKDINGYCHYETEDYYIDNLLKEMEGKNENLCL